MEKTYIAVDYVEKDEAKALGAKWDSDRRSWYIPEGVDPRPFDRWLPKEDSFIYVVVSHRVCWKCGEQTTVVAFGVPYGEPYDFDECDWGEGLYPAYDPGTYDALALVPRLGSTPKELRDYLEKEYGYRPKMSRTTGLLQLNNTCDCCGSLQGEFFDFDEPGGAFALASPADIEHLEFYRVPVKGFVYGLVNRWTSMDEAVYRHAQRHYQVLDLGVFENIYLN